nr:glycosyltransferase family 4 protein [Limisphaera ngatamarikiensis]
MLVFAHTPPPHHGQSYMVELMLRGFGGDCRTRPRSAGPHPLGIECYHVNARVSKDLQDIGEFRPAKLVLLLFYCLQALWIRFRYGVENFYYVPAPGKYSALYRDWLVLGLCRPFFKRLILHWHAAGLGRWLETVGRMPARVLTWRAFRDADLFVVLSRFNRGDVQKFWPRRVAVVPNGIPDPCPQFETNVLPRRLARLAVRRALVQGRAPSEADRLAAGADADEVKVLFLGHCLREKGLFDAIEGVAGLHRRLRREGVPLRLRLLVAGSFPRAEEEAEFRALQADPEVGPLLTYLGFVSGERKEQALREADLMCFPTFYPAESFGLVIVEALAFGLPVVTTRYRSIAEVLPPEYPGVVPSRNPAAVTEALARQMWADDFVGLRRHFLNQFTLEKHLERLAAAFHRLEVDDPTDLTEFAWGWAGGRSGR